MMSAVFPRSNGLRSALLGAVLTLAALGQATVPSQADTAATATNLTSTPNPSTYGLTATFTATISGFGGGAPTGTVTFNDGTTALDTIAVDTVGVGYPIRGGESHTCALTSAGGVKCWGRNDFGQLGDGTTTPRNTPVDVIGLSSGVIGIAAGISHSCALTSAGGVKCWGDNSSGELGDDTTTERHTPVDVIGLTSGVSAIAAGGLHSCALTGAGGVKCWGENFTGELGDDTTTERHTPVDVSGLTSGVSAVTAGNYHTCALTSAGGVKCWGENITGELGDGTTTERHTPVDVSGLASGASAVAAGNYHTCALTSAGGVKCWGYNEFGQLGDGTTTTRTAPVDVSGLTGGISAIAAGFDHTCAVTGAGGVKCWGDNFAGELGDGSTTERHTPVDVSGLSALVFSKATLPISSLTVGDHTITAVYGGDGGHDTSTSPTLTQTVNQATTTALNSSQNPSVFGQSVTFTATVSATAPATGTPSGSVTFMDGPSMLGTGTLSGGMATYATSALSVGAHQKITAVYGGGAGFAMSTSSDGTQMVNQGATTTSVVATPNPSKRGQSVTFTATVSAMAPASGTPTGTVTFKAGLSTLGTGSLSAGTATYATSALAVGGHTITAVYGGNSSFTTSTSTGITQTVNKGATTTRVTATPNPSKRGQSVTFTATVSATAPATGTPSGTVTFKDGSTTLGTGSLSAGTATYATSAFAVGGHTITAVYGGNTSFTTSTSTGITQTVNKGATTTSVAATPNPSTLGQSVSFTATVAVTAPASGTPTGTVTFKDGASTLGTGTLSSGTATFATASLVIDAHTITAVYGGDTNFVTSTSSGMTQTVDKNATTMSVSASPNPSKPGQSVSFTATVAVTAPATGTPTGMITFKQGTKTLGTGTLSSGTATFATAALTTGIHTVRASFDGTSTLAASKSSVTLAVDPRVGPEFRVNTQTANSQQQPSVARLTGNGFVVAWASNLQDGSGYGIYGQRYSNIGAKIGGEFRVNTTTANDQSQPSTAALPDGFVVTWRSVGQNELGFGIYGQRFTAAGAKAGGEFRVNTTTVKNQSEPSVAGLGGGRFVVAWTSDGTDTSGLGVYAQRYDGNGKAAGSEFRVNTTTAKDQSRPSAAAITGGGFVITWQSDGDDGSGLGIYGQRYDAAGASVGNEFRVNTTVANDQSLPSIAGLKDGGFVVTWQSNGQDGSGLGVYGQRYGNTGAKAGGEFRVNTVTANDQWQPSVAAFTSGGFVVAWSSNGQDGSGRGVYAQAYDAAGKRVDIEFRVNTTITNNQWQPSVAAFSGGNFVVAWTSKDQDGSLEGVYGQRFNMMGVAAAADKNDHWFFLSPGSADRNH